MAAGTAYLDELRTLDFGGAAIQHKVIFVDLPIACVTDGGRAVIDEFRNQQVAHIKVLCACLQSLGHLLDHLLDACTLFPGKSSIHTRTGRHAQKESNVSTGSSGLKKLSTPHLPSNLLVIPSLPSRAGIIAALSARLASVALPLDRHHAAAAAVTISVSHMRHF